MSERSWHRARVFLRAVLPLVRVVATQKPGRFSFANGTVCFEGPEASLQSVLRFTNGVPERVRDEEAKRIDPSLVFGFRDTAQMNAFFAGKPVVPAVRPWLGLRHPVLLAATTNALLSLRVLEPQTPEALAKETHEEQSLRVRLLLYLVTASIAQLHADGFREVQDLAHDSPERVYQWTVEGSDIATFIRMREGKLHAGRGTYARKKPFVHFVFRDVRAAHMVLTAQGSQMTTFRGGLVATHGSPEYARKVALLMQKVDELLLEG